MQPTTLLLFVIGYFLLLLFVAYLTSKKSNNDSFFIGNRNSNWMLVAFGMIGTSLSGVTFVSVPGTVGASNFGYYQLVIGFFLGYFVVAFVLLPVYYRLKLTSIYTYLHERIGIKAYKTGSLFFILSRTLGATVRLYLVINVLQLFILDKLGISFALTTFIILILILLYTVEGGVKTIVFTDTLQTTFMLLGLVVCIFALISQLNFGVFESISKIADLPISNIWNFDVNSNSYFLKQIVGGAFITIAMTGLDQEMMQKNISVAGLKNSQKNMITFSGLLLIINMLFLFLGACLYLYAQQHNLSFSSDDLFPSIALNGFLSPAISVIFIIGLISALFPSADGALTALTSAYCIDILGINRNANLSESQRKRKRVTVHIIFAIIFFICVMVFKWVDNKTIVDLVFKLAGYTYGPLLGLFMFGILTKRTLKDSLVPMLCGFSVLMVFILDVFCNATWFSSKLGLPNGLSNSLIELSENIFGGYKIGHEMLLINGLLTFMLLIAFSSKKEKQIN